MVSRPVRRRPGPDPRSRRAVATPDGVAVAAAILAERAAMSADDPEPQIASSALLGLWRIHYRSLSKYLDGTHTPAQVHQAVAADIHRAARLIDTGLASLTDCTPGPNGRPGY